VVRIVIDSTSSVAGQPSYEPLTGRAFGELDPADSLNSIVTDIGAAPRVHGKVTYVASFVIRKPKVLTSASGLMWHDVPNRGGNVALTADLAAAGDVQLLSGWQGDNAGGTAVPANAECLPPYTPPCGAPPLTNHWVKVPALKGVTGRIVGRIINRSGLGGAPLNVMGNPIPYFPAPNNDDATLTVHLHETINGIVTEGETIPRGAWKFCGGGTYDAPAPVTTLPVQICLKHGFDPFKL
jgi:hypothetical protein